MPDPNSHAGLTPLVKHEPMPSLWWLTPWTFAVQQWNARANLHAQCQDLQDDLATARQDAANFSDHATYHEQRYADQSHELNALNQALNGYRTAWHEYINQAKTYVYERPVIKAKRQAGAEGQGQGRQGGQAERMSEVKRYSLALHKVKGKFESPEFERDNGEWVKFDDYARLKAEVEAQAKRWAESEDLILHYKQQRDEAYNDCECHRLKAEVERLTVEADWKTPARKIKALEAEVERLRKAGDAMATNIPRMVTCQVTAHEAVDFMNDWNAAKEGKQS